MTRPNVTADQLSDLVEEERQRFAVPGCAVLVVHHGTVLLAAGFGQRDVDANEPVQPTTLFPIGSSTKTFTAAVCATFVDEGRMEWDTPVREYLPELRMYDDDVTRQLTLRDMLSHRSGLPRHDLLWYGDEGAVTRGDIVRALRHLEPSKGLRELWQYNNLLYITAGELAGQLHGGSYEDAVRDRVLRPLGMDRTNFSVRELEQDKDAALGYAVSPGETKPRRLPYASLGVAGAAGNINSTITDLTPWLFSLLGRGSGDRPPLLGGTTLAAMATPTTPMGAGSQLQAARPVGYGLGLFIDDHRGLRIAHHGGNIDGFSSMVSFVPDADLGIVVLTNRNGTALRDALPLMVFERILGLEPQPHGERLHAAHSALASGAQQAKEARKSSARPLAAPRPLGDYAGRYEHPAYGRLTVRVEGDGLAGELRSIKGQLQHRHLEVFELTATLAGEEQRLPVQFTSNFEADVTAALMPLEPAVAPIRFERQPDTDHLTDELLDRLAGPYALGPVQAVVRRKGAQGLTVSVAGGPAAPLEPVQGLAFRLGGQRVEFAEDGSALRSQMGDFTRAG